MRQIVVAVLVACSAVPSPLTGQAAHRAGPRALLPRDVEISLARSAAPPGVSSTARVLAFTDSGFVVADSGTSDVTCIVNRSWPASLEPHCFDAEASASILPIEIRRTELYHEGRSDAEVEREIASGLASGRFRAPRRPAMSYMMSDAQRLIGDDGSPAGRWRPHVMVYFPGLSNAEVGLRGAPDMRVGMVTDERTPFSSLMIVVPQFVTAPPRE